MTDGAKMFKEKTRNYLMIGKPSNSQLFNRAMCFMRVPVVRVSIFSNDFTYYEGCWKVRKL